MGEVLLIIKSAKKAKKAKFNRKKAELILDNTYQMTAGVSYEIAQ